MCQMAPSALGTNGQRPEPLFCSSQLPVPTVGASRILPKMSENHSLAATWDRSTTEAQMRELSQFLSSPVFYSSKSFSVPVGKLGVVCVFIFKLLLSCSSSSPAPAVCRWRYLAAADEIWGDSTKIHNGRQETKNASAVEMIPYYTLQPTFISFKILHFSRYIRVGNIFLWCK